MVASGTPILDIIKSSPVGPRFGEATDVLERALGIYERLGDRTGVMSTVIAMAYTQYAPVMHLSSSARHLEEIRRVTSRLSELVTESERARLELQMLFGVHVYAMAKEVPDLALSRGEDAHRAAKLQGERAIEFLAAGGVAVGLLELGDVDGAERWISLAAAAAALAPSRTRARQLETWRGMARVVDDDAEGMRRHLEQAVAMATEGASARCESLARLAMEASKLLARRSAAGHAPDDGLVELVERSTTQAKDLLPLLPGHAPWGAQVHAALATVALVRGDNTDAAAEGGAALQALQAGLHEDVSLEIVIPAAQALIAGAPADVQASVKSYLQLTLSRIARGTADEATRVRWLKGPLGRELVALAGPMAASVPEQAAPGSAPGDAEPSLDDTERHLLQLLTEGRTNAEIATELELGEDDVAQRLARLQARLGTSSRAEATSLAFRGLAAVGSH